MKISGFTFVRNADKYYFPVKASICSVLPLVDEFIVALGQGDSGDRTREIIESIGSPKIKLFDRVWDQEKFKAGTVFREETNFALEQCTGDWCFYIQADELAHEQDHDAIRKACTEHLDNPAVQGFLFHYNHFWGDYDHVLRSHAWYRQEIRLVRNKINVKSIKDAQSFRIGGSEKMRVKPLPASIYHYGWVRPPSVMQSKKKEQEEIYWGNDSKNTTFKTATIPFNYGALGRLPTFKGTHPPVLEEWRSKMDWSHQLNQGKQQQLKRELFKHEKVKDRTLSFVENHLFGGKTVFGYSNWTIVK